MVRRIRNCFTCQNRFVSFANEPFCSRCKRRGVSSEASSAAVTATAAGKRPETDEQGFDEIVAIGDSDDHSATDALSEGAEEVHCTQLDDFDEDIQEEETTSNCVEDQSDQDICFICGSSLENLKNRIDHIKRCSKKHGITGRDVKLNNDHEEFVNPPTVSDRRNPYNNKENDWHGEATLDLKMAGQNMESNSSIQHQSTNSTKQSSLSSYFQMPVRNVNNVLLSGAKRISKMTEQNSTHKYAKKNPKQRRRSFGGGNGRKDYSKMTCPSYKRIPSTDFVCDGFQYAKCANTNKFFLTHFHADHYGGITSSWDSGLIYCSLPTATLVAQQLGVNKKFIHPLPMKTPTVIETGQGKPVTVTLLDANHCPGAVMFLFEVGKRKILHVGDFRWDRDFMLKQAPLRALQKSTLNDLFLDTTYCDPKYSLPSQKAAINATIEVFEREVKSGVKTLHLFGAYTIGKEKMYLSVAMKLKMKVYVDNRRHRILSALQWPKECMNLLTTRKEEASIWVVPLGDINFKKMPGYLPTANSKPFAFPFKRVVGYRPTGWSMGGKPASSLVSTRKSDNITIYSIPYSEHSSFPELLDCLDCLQPQRIIPTVSASKSEEQVNVLLKSLRQKQTTLPFTK